MKFLVIEDSESLNNIISEILRTFEGISDVESAYDGERGLFLAEANKYDLIILDLMLPKMDGKDVLRKLRQKSNCPVLVLTALNDIDTKVELLELGADDYITKPFERAELLARVLSILRRYNDNFGVNIYRYENMEVNFFKKQVTINGERVEIVGKLFELLEYLVRNKEQILSKDSVFNRIWGFESETISTVVEVYVSKLRKILANYGLNDNITTIKNVGYIWSERT